MQIRETSIIRRVNIYFGPRISGLWRFSRRAAGKRTSLNELLPPCHPFASLTMNFEGFKPNQVRDEMRMLLRSGLAEEDTLKNSSGRIQSLPNQPRIIAPETDVDSVLLDLGTGEKVHIAFETDEHGVEQVKVPGHIMFHNFQDRRKYVQVIINHLKGRLQRRYGDSGIGPVFVRGLNADKIDYFRCYNEGIFAERGDPLGLDEILKYHTFAPVRYGPTWRGPWLNGEFKIMIVDGRYIQRGKEGAIPFLVPSMGLERLYFKQSAHINEANPIVIEFVGIKDALLAFEAAFKDHFGGSLYGPESVHDGSCYNDTFFHYERQLANAADVLRHEHNIIDEFKKRGANDMTTAHLLIIKKALSTVFTSWILSPDEEAFLQRHKQQLPYLTINNR